MPENTLPAAESTADSLAAPHSPAVAPLPGALQGGSRKRKFEEGISDRDLEKKVSHEGKRVRIDFSALASSHQGSLTGGSGAHPAAEESALPPPPPKSPRKRAAEDDSHEDQPLAKRRSRSTTPRSASFSPLHPEEDSIAPAPSVAPPRKKLAPFAPSRLLRKGQTPPVSSIGNIFSDVPVPFQLMPNLGIRMGAPLPSANSSPPTNPQQLLPEGSSAVTALSVAALQQFTAIEGNDDKKVGYEEDGVSVADGSNGPSSTRGLEEEAEGPHEALSSELAAEEAGTLDVTDVIKRLEAQARVLQKLVEESRLFHRATELRLESVLKAVGASES